MTFDQALRRYCVGAFTDEDVTRCTGLSGRAYRELIKVGAVGTTTEKPGPGRVRVCDATTFKRLAVIASLNQSGLSLAMAGRVAYFPLDFIFYNVCDPSFILLDFSAAIDPNSGLPPRLKTPKENWFEPDEPANANPGDDWLIEIYDGRFVGCIYPEETEPMIYGDLRSSSQFVAWSPHHESMGYVPGVRLAAEAAVRSPVVKTTINASLAVRKALRRYLGLDPAIPVSNIGGVP